MFGVGHQVFKGLALTRGGHGRGNGKKQKVDANAFWTLYNARAKQAGVSMDAAKAPV